MELASQSVHSQHAGDRRLGRRSATGIGAPLPAMRPCIDISTGFPPLLAPPPPPPLVFTLGDIVVLGRTPVSAVTEERPATPREAVEGFE